MHPMFRVNTSFSGWSFTDERYEFVKLKGLIYRLIIQTLYPGMHGMVLRSSAIYSFEACRCCCCSSSSWQRTVTADKFRDTLFMLLLLAIV